MVVKRGGLGKGLDSLIPQNKTVQATERASSKSKEEKPVVKKEIVEKVVENVEKSCPTTKI